jgi:hypothetical protein
MYLDSFRGTAVAGYNMLCGEQWGLSSKRALQAAAATCHPLSAAAAASVRLLLRVSLGGFCTQNIAGSCSSARNIPHMCGGCSSKWAATFQKYPLLHLTAM